MQLSLSLKQVLEKIDFLDRYRELRNKFPYTDESLEDYSNHEVLKIIESFGYPVRFDKREDFYEIKESIDGFAFQFNICVKYGITELIWGLTKNGERLTLGGPWGLICDLLIGDDCNIKLPAFRDYEDLRQILKEAFAIYEDFKREVLI